jgi:hypothetical protein
VTDRKVEIIEFGIVIHSKVAFFGFFKKRKWVSLDAWGT